MKSSPIEWVVKWFRSGGLGLGVVA